MGLPEKTGADPRTDRSMIPTDLKIISGTSMTKRRKLRDNKLFLKHMGIVGAGSREPSDATHGQGKVRN